MFRIFGTEIRRRSIAAIEREARERGEFGYVVEPPRGEPYWRYLPEREPRRTGLEAEEAK